MIKSNLSDESLDRINGGSIFRFNDKCEIISDFNGNVLKRFNTLEDAENYAKERKISTRRVKWDYLNALRKLAKEDLAK